MTTRPKALAIVATVVVVVAWLLLLLLLRFFLQLHILLCTFCLLTVLLQSLLLFLLANKYAKHQAGRQATAAAAAAQAQLKLKTKNELRHVPRRCITNIASRLLPAFLPPSPPLPSLAANLGYNFNSNCWLCLWLELLQLKAANLIYKNKHKLHTRNYA